MDFSNIVIAALALVGSLAGSFMAQSKTVALLSYRINQLEEKVNKHNQIVERTYKLESDVSTAFDRIDEVRIAVKDLDKEMYDHEKHEQR